MVFHSFGKLGYVELGSTSGSNDSRVTQTASFVEYGWSKRDGWEKYRVEVMLVGHENVNCMNRNMEMFDARNGGHLLVIGLFQISFPRRPAISKQVTVA